MRSFMPVLVMALFASTSAAQQEEDPAQVMEVEPEPEAPQAQGARQAESQAALQDPPATQPARRPPSILSDDTPVKLPWSEVAKLLEQARRARPERAAIPFSLGEARIEGETDGRTLVVRLELPVHLSDGGWTAVPLWRAPAAVRRATLDGRPAAVSVERGAAVLLARGQGAHALRAELVVALAGAGDRVQLGFATPVTASWRLRLPGKAARIEPAVQQRFRGERGGVVLEATTAPAETLSIDWAGARTGAAPSRVSVESFTYVVYREDTTSGRSTFEFQITGGGREALSVSLPAAMELLSVEGRDLAHWAVEGTGADKRLVASFVRAQRGRVPLRLGFELPKPAETAELPVLVAQDVDEQRAWLAASAESPVSIAQERMQGGEAVDVKHLPAHLVSGVTLPFTLAWRHPGKEFSGQVRIARHATVSLPQATIDAAYFTTVLTEEGQEVVKATFLVKNNLKPYLAVTLPGGSRLWAAFVSGDPVNPSYLAGGPDEARSPGPPLAPGQAHPPGPALATRHDDGGVVLLPLVKSRDVGSGENLAVHHIEEGWSLSDLALSYYHDASKWKVIAVANQNLFGEGGQPQVGQSLVIPRLAAAAGASELETAFPVEIVYSRDNRAPGLAGSLHLEVPSTDLGVMSAIWTVYLPSRLDPLHFSGNLTQYSSIRYGLLRRLRHLVRSPLAALASPMGTPAAQAGEASLRKRFAFDEEAQEDQAARAHPRVSLPLVGRAYLFKRYLLEGEEPSLSAVYLDRRFEAPIRWAMLGAGFALTLCLLGVWRWRRSTAGMAIAAALFSAATLAVGHFVLGTHRHALTGVVLAAWLALSIEVRKLPLASARLLRMAQQLVRWGNVVLLLLTALAGLGWATAVLGAAFAVPGLVWLWRAHRPAGGGTPAAGAALAAILCLVLPAGARAAQLPPGAEVTVPFSQLKGLVGEDARPLPPPRAFTTVSADYRASLAGERLEVEARIAVEVHADGWVAIPLIARAHALTAVKVDGRPAAAALAGGRYQLPLRGPGAHAVELSFLVKADPGLARLELVPGVAGTLTARLPAAGMHPEVAQATEVRVEGAVLHALLPEDGRAELYWSAPSTSAGDAAAPRGEVRMVARTLQIVSPEEQRIRVFAAVRYLVQRGGQNRFAVRLPEGVELLDAQGQGIAEHAVTSRDGASVLEVTTASLVRDAFELSFAYDWKPPRDGGTLPTFQVLDVRSETGALGIESAGNLELKVTGVDGAAAIDVRSAPELLEHTDKPILHAVRYLQHPYAVRVAFERHPEKELDAATVDQASYTTVVAADGRAMTRGVFRMRNARQAFLGIDLPAGKGLESELQSVIIGGEPAKPVRDASGRLLLPLMRSPSVEREMRQFEVEVVYLSRIAGMPRSGAVPALLPSIDLRISKVEWSLYLPPGIRASSRQRTEAAHDRMQWATAPRAMWARALAPRSEGQAVASGGMLPVRFNLPEHGRPETFWRHYLPAGTQPAFEIEYGPRSTRAALQVAMVLAGLGMVVAGGWALRRRRSA